MTTYAGRWADGAGQFFQPGAGNVAVLVASTHVAVYARGTTTYVTLYTDRTKGTSINQSTNPVSTDAEGNFTFFADPGEYDLALGTSTFQVTVANDPAEPVVLVDGTITDAKVNAAAAIAFSKLAAPTADTSWANHKITDLGMPTAAGDAASKSYADAIASGLVIKTAARVATTANRALSGFAAVDSVTPIDADRVLLMGQTTGSQNGLWVAHTGAWTRPTDFAAGSNAKGAYVLVTEGTVNGGASFVESDTSAKTVDTDAQTWSQFSSANQVQAGSGLSKTGNVMSIPAGGVVDSMVTSVAESKVTNLVGDLAVLLTVVALTDGATINTDASAGHLFSVTLGGNRTIANPTNPRSGQRIVYRLKQDATGSRTITWGAAFRFGTDLPQPTLTTTAAKTDYIGFLYNGADSKWDCLAYAGGYG